MAWRRDGFFVVPKLVRAVRARELAEACDHVLERVRASGSSSGRTSTHVASLFDPHWFDDRPELLARLTRFATARDVLALLADLGADHEGALNLRDAQYFHEPSARDYDGAWHRDGDVVDLPQGAVEPRSTLLRLRVAFAHDDHLELIPGSHERADTPEETRARRGTIRNLPLASGSVRVTLAPGDACVFDTWMIHRGRYRHGVPRRTLDLQYGFGPRKSRLHDAVRALALAARKLD